MSQVITSTIVQKEAIMVDSPMQLDGSKDRDSSEANKLSPDQPPPAPPLPPLSILRRLPVPGSMASGGAAARQAASESEKSSENATDASSSDKAESVTNDEGAAGEGGSEDHMCVCTPAVQRVPRPANFFGHTMAANLVRFAVCILEDFVTTLTINMEAFILYRSRMHSQVAHENPGLSNPQISRVLGERWAKEPPDVKAQWKTLAVEESKRHIQRYPGYKYQPRRKGSKAPTSQQPDEEAGKCSKCNGRYYKGQQTPSLPPPTTQPGMEQQVYLTPTSASSVSDEAYRARFESAASGTRAPGPPMNLDVSSPDSKRRRLAEAVESRSIAPIRVNPYNRIKPGQSVRTPTPTSGPYSATRGFDSPLPQLGSMTRPQGGAMPPPPRPDHAAAWPTPRYSQSGRSGIAEESLRLPPLQTAIPPPSPAREADTRYGYTPITSAIPPNIKDLPPQEQIMSIQLSKKLGVLSKICPPLPRSVQGTGALPQGRGPIIAVEGPNDSLVREVGRSVEKALLVAPKDIAHIALEVWHNDFPSDIPVPDEIGSGRDSPTVELGDVIPSIFRCIVEWHEKSKRMIRHVQGGEDNFATRSTNPMLPKLAGASGSDDDSGKLSLPVALIQGGFSLSVSDKFAYSTSYSVSNYAPVDHWQWMATLWRGIIGTDLVVYVKPSTEEEMSKSKNVEVSEKQNAITVRLAPNRGLDEATERRLSFEVIEWMRSGWIRDGRPRSS